MSVAGKFDSISKRLARPLFQPGNTRAVGCSAQGRFRQGEGRWHVLCASATAPCSGLGCWQGSEELTAAAQLPGQRRPGAGRDPLPPNGTAGRCLWHAKEPPAERAWDGQLPATRALAAAQLLECGDGASGRCILSYPISTPGVLIKQTARLILHTFC